MFCVSVKVKISVFFIVKVKLTVLLLCVCVHSAWKGRPRNDLHRVARDLKPYSLTHSLRYVQGVWPNTTADFRGSAIVDPKNFV